MLKKIKTLKRKPQFVVLLTIHFTFPWKKESFGGNEMRDLVYKLCIIFQNLIKRCATCVRIVHARLTVSSTRRNIE